MDASQQWVRLVGSVVFGNVLLGAILLWLVRRRHSQVDEAEPQLRPRVRSRYSAILIDVNNVRGGLQFDRDIDEMVTCLVRWAANEPDGPIVVMEVDHGPAARTFALANSRCLVCFAGPRMEADDTIVCGVHFFARRGERVLVASSDSNLRTRCSAAAAPPPEDGVAMPSKGTSMLDFLHRTSFSDLPAPGTRRGGELEDMLLGPGPLSAKAAAAVRTARRERAGTKTELSNMRVEQAEVLFRRLAAAADAGGLVSVPTSGVPPSAPGDHRVLAPDSARAHGVWLNEPVELEALRRRLKEEMNAFWDRKLFG